MTTSHTISLSTEAEVIWEKEFGPKSGNFQGFSAWVSEQLLKKNDGNMTIDEIKKALNEQKNIEKQAKNAQKSLKNALKMAEIEQKKAKNLTDFEIFYLADSKNLTENGIKIEPRINGFNNIFNKKLSKTDFIKKMDESFNLFNQWSKNKQSTIAKELILFLGKTELGGRKK